LSRARLAASLTVLLALLAPASAHGARSLRLGFFDDVYGALPAERDPWLARTVAVSADIVRIQIGWPAPNTAARPAGFDARDPTDPNYDFRRADASIVAATARGLQVLASFSAAPRWAEGSERPVSALPGSWKPSTEALEDYGAALARRYGQLPRSRSARREPPPGRGVPGLETSPTSAGTSTPSGTGRGRRRRRCTAPC
jgi:hypothetical protein